MSKQLRKPVRTRRLGAVGALVVAAVVTAAGCSSGSSGTEQDASQPLEVWIRQDAGSPAAESAKALTKAFTEKSGIEAKLVAVGVTTSRPSSSSAPRRRTSPTSSSTTPGSWAMR
ncbi:hypothetical protein [Streptomyces albogriseolus]|uniref:hypothetical protein n=1 Tax=Streptomyces albogriseolus TaxID=1887 RepID=UPI00345F6089